MEYSVGAVLETALQAGHILLENGAEIFRVEDTMRRISRYFGVDDENKEFFTLTNGLFATGYRDGQRFAKVQPSLVQGAHLNRVVAINQLSRQIERGEYTLEEVRERLREIRVMPGMPKSLRILSAGFGAGAFCCMFGGGLAETLAAMLAGLFLYVFVLFVTEPHLSKITGNLLGGAIITVVCLLCQRMGLGEDLSPMIIGGIMPLIPGVAFTNGIRDIADGDYLSGVVRLLDTLLVFTCMAIGVGLVFTIYRRIWGGAIL